MLRQVSQFVVRPTVDELKSLWLFAYARSSLYEAMEWLDLLPKLPAGSALERAVICAAVVAYVRPFSECRVRPKEKIVPLKGVAPPDDLAGNHQDAIDLRNKMIGHKDATPAERHSSTPNMVLAHVENAHVAFHTTMIGGMDDSVRLALKNLCLFFIAHCEKYMKPITKVLAPEIRRKYQPGIYELVISEAPNEWIKPFKPPASAA